MMEVSLYIDVSCKRIRAGKASFCYVLEYVSPSGVTYTRAEIGCMEASGIRMVLTAVVRALKRLKAGCKVTIYTDLQHLESAFSLGWLENWKNTGWMRQDGEEVKNRDLWEEIAKLASIHKVSVCRTGKSSYTAWMQTEMKKAELEPGEYKEVKGQ